MSHEFNRSHIEQIISQAKQERARYMREICGPALKAPALKTIGGLTLLLVFIAALIQSSGW